jgi:hypothetical protein
MQGTCQLKFYRDGKWQLPELREGDSRAGQNFDHNFLPIPTVAKLWEELLVVSPSGSYRYCTPPNRAY